MNRIPMTEVNRALALIGQPRETCRTCGHELGAKSRVAPTHTPLSAALACGINPQIVYRAYKRQKSA